MSENWPAENFIPFYIRDPEERSKDFGLVNQGYLGHMNVGYSAREVEMFVWLEALRYGIPEFRLPNELIDDVVGKIELLGGRFVPNFIVGKTATLDDLKKAGFWRIFIGAGLPRFGQFRKQEGESKVRRGLA